MKIKIIVSRHEGASEYGETWDEYSYQAAEIPKNWNGEDERSENVALVKIIDVKGIPLHLKQDFLDKLQQHFNDRYIQYLPDFHLTSHTIRNSMCYSHAYTRGAVQGLFINLNLTKDPALKVSQYLTSNEGRTLAASSRQSHNSAYEEVQRCKMEL